MSQKPKIGELARDIMRDVTKPQKVMKLAEDGTKDYLKELKECAERGAERFKHDFFIEVLTIGNELLYNVFRFKFVDRRYCPEPNYDQSVYKYNYKDHQVEYLWTIPDRESTLLYFYNQHKVVESEQWILSFILRFQSGDLRKLMNELNGEDAEKQQIQTEGEINV